MAASVPDIVQELISSTRTSQVVDYCFVAAGAAVIYDHLRTLPREVRFIWQRRSSVVSLLFHLNRWGIIVWSAVNVAGVFVKLRSLKGCLAMNLLSAAVTILLILLWAAFSAIRVFAISRRNWWLASIVLLLSMMPAGTNAWYYFWELKYSVYDSPYWGIMCNYTARSPTLATDNIRLTFADRICLISADGIILCATWFNTYAIRARTSDTIADRVNNRTALVTTLLMDGTVYFLALLAVNVLNIVAKATGVSEALGTFITPLSSMIISHFLLNLRQAESQPWGDAVSSQHHAYSSKINFALATLVNDMSEDLSHGAILADPDIDWSRIRDDGDDDLPTGADDSNPPAADLERV